MIEYNEEIDKDMNVLRTVPRKAVVEENLLHKMVVVVLINDAGKFYVNQRKSTKKVCPLKWVVGAGGAVIAGESFEHAAKRELMEECGIEAEVKFLFDFEYESDIIRYMGKIFMAQSNVEVKLNEQECEQGKWISRVELQEMAEHNELCPDTALYISEFLEKH
ncbi:MAG: NUDIX domain-containing protein [Nanoarchaeota archaeon]|nr:NUDIX domain-containing protein [Nanoarchaeota archaeon]